MHAEARTFRGRSDAVIQLGDTVYVIELKLVHNAEALPASILEGQGQMAGRGYAEGCRAKGRRVLEAVVVVDGKLRQAVCIPAVASEA
ncbi:MAG: PD-(D/E)XK nuclease domain-containing protein [Desulfovibrio sp.]|nr:PD-(D/E)XK nuclease domain-containing protein [Desulfovibrio sp.]